MGAETFTSAWKLTAVGGSRYQLMRDYGGYLVTETADEAGDNQTQLGDIADDHYHSQGVGIYSGNMFVGDVNHGAGFVGHQAGYGDYFYTSNAYSAGDYVTIDGDHFTLACYVTGSSIRTEAGDRPVETLAIGDRVVTASGVVRPIKWIGHRSYAARFLAARPDAWPVCFKAGSIADNVPVRDLRVSPRHAMYLEGVLIEAKDLVNGISVVWSERIDELRYWHIELDSHDVLIAEGALSESFVDNESRGMFHNAHEYAVLYPDEPALAVRSYAPRVEDGHRFAAARRAIDLRAGLMEGARGRM